MTSFDYPFNERVRSLLRVEDLLQRTIANLKSEDEHDHLLALQSLLQLGDVIERTEMKLDLLQELNKQKLFMSSIKDKQIVNVEKISALIVEIDRMSTTLQKDKSKLGQHLRTNEWLMTVKQRFSLPGGICKYDLPSFQHWLEMSPEKRRINLSTWLRPLIPMQQAVYLLLYILRGNGKTQNKHAMAGTFHQLMGGVQPSQMLRITLPDTAAYFPEVSANKHAINIRFNVLDANFQQQKVDADIPFDLTLCNL
jgi:cell division protein ZapD